MDRIRGYVAREKLKSVGIVWASGLGITLAYQWSKPIPLQMKIIHSRVAAQALTLGALAAAAALHLTGNDENPTGGSGAGV
ncbi:hypothetical protein Ndes2526B_g04901 [Nannochloris sp. 'desiccata']